MDWDELIRPEVAPMVPYSPGLRASEVRGRSGVEQEAVEQREPVRTVSDRREGHDRGIATSELVLRWLGSCPAGSP
jgi:hypothetical protein